MTRKNAASLIVARCCPYLLLAHDTPEKRIVGFHAIAN